MKTFKKYVNTFHFSLYKTSAKADMKLITSLHEVVIGSMLGDLTAEKPGSRNNTRLQFKQSTVNMLYINHLYDLFKDYCGSKPINLPIYDGRVNKMKMYYSIKFQTLSLPCFNIYRQMFYNPEGVKIIPENLELLLTERGLAYWIMDDGYKTKKGIYISTESYSLNEVKFLCKILNNKFCLECSPHITTNGYRLYIFSSSKEKLIKIIRPYFL